MLTEAGFVLLGAVVGWVSARAWVGWAWRTKPTVGVGVPRYETTRLNAFGDTSRIPVREEPTGRRAFLYAYETLQWLKARGVVASAQLYHDGSGGLHLSPVEWAILQASPAWCRELENHLHSVRWTQEGSDFVLTSCQGWHPDD